ncbi:hypothetical protein [Azospirillum argentinense]|uniref:hypothetical protein n=1 Tax=Azospirillum argentinense TaxID=2970906 RepID=UPI0032DF4578
MDKLKEAAKRLAQMVADLIRAIFTGTWRGARYVGRATVTGARMVGDGAVTAAKAAPGLAWEGVKASPGLALRGLGATARGTAAVVGAVAPLAALPLTVAGKLGAALTSPFRSSVAPAPDAATTDRQQQRAHAAQDAKISAIDEAGLVRRWAKGTSKGRDMSAIEAQMAPEVLAWLRELDEAQLGVIANSPYTAIAEHLTGGATLAGVPTIGQLVAATPGRSQAEREHIAAFVDETRGVVAEEGIPADSPFAARLRERQARRRGRQVDEAGTAPRVA